MSELLSQLEGWLQEKEAETCEFKEAKNRFDFEELVKHSVSMANNGGGRILLGVTDKRPRQVVGTQAFDQPERTRNGLRERIHLGVNFEVINHPSGRVLVFEIPSRPVGTPVQDKGIYWTRDGDSLVPMTPEQLRDVFAEGGRDFSAEVCPNAALTDLDMGAVEDFRRRWMSKSGNNSSTVSLRPQLILESWHDFT